jgi:polyisoprenoid-binding protein YceI
MGREMTAYQATKRVQRLATTTVMCVLLSACSTATPTPAPTAATSATSAPAPTSTTWSSGSENPASGIALVVDSSNSSASYHAQEQLAGRNLPSEAVGTTPHVSGSILLAPDGSIAANQSQIQVDLRSLASDQSRRDNFIKGNTLQTNSFPNATFVPRQARGLPSPLPTSGQATFQLLGDLTVHGVTRPVTWQVTTQFDGGSVSGNATTNVNISDFGMTPPKAGPVLSIEDGLLLELTFSATREEG